MANNHMSPARRHVSTRLTIIALVAAFATAGAGHAFAQQASSCQADMENLAKKRVVNMEELNRLAKAGKGKLDPIAACPRLRSLAAAEAEFVAYMTKNKDWCSIPDALIENMTTGHAKTIKFAAQACNIAAQVKKQQQQQAQQAAAGAASEAVRLPAGPL
jgi:hypothetical protein